MAVGWDTSEKNHTYIFLLPWHHVRPSLNPDFNMLVLSVTQFFFTAGYGAPTKGFTLLDVESWEDVGVLAWGSEAHFSRLNAPTILKFLEDGITGKVLLALSEEKLKMWGLRVGPAIELLLAINTLKAEIGTRVI